MEFTSLVRALRTRFCCWRRVWGCCSSLKAEAFLVEATTQTRRQQPTRARSTEESRIMIIEVKAYQDTEGNQPYAKWLDGLTDNKAKARIVVRINRLAAGNLGDCQPLRDGVQELRIDYGPGYRVYLSRQGPVMVLLLCGGNKGTQSRDINLAIEYLNDWKQRGKP